ncbi:helix-turn-helix transcriptional regulator [Janthinobacterium sp. LB3P112]|uniref:helix-turn-helix transcriptional regulator n=1 Tax=Janthinobacterium sp. LB3P112 TaxID=3424196 RepID=UPI003F2921CB
MKIDASTVRRLRPERAWSQEQLATSADVSLRTIQRVEADGSASNETRMALAAVFGIDVRVLSLREPAPQDSPLPVAAISSAALARYRAAGLLALLAAGAALLSALDWLLPAAMPVACMLAVAATLYAGLGWYFTGQAALATPARRTAQFGFVFGALALLFASFSATPRALAMASLQMTLFACVIRYMVDWYFSRRRDRSGIAKTGT